MGSPFKEITGVDITANEKLNTIIVLARYWLWWYKYKWSTAGQLDLYMLVSLFDIEMSEAGAIYGNIIGFSSELLAKQNEVRPDLFGPDDMAGNAKLVADMLLKSMSNRHKERVIVAWRLKYPQCEIINHPNMFIQLSILSAVMNDSADGEYYSEAMQTAMVAK